MSAGVGYGPQLVAAGEALGYGTGPDDPRRRRPAAPLAGAPSPAQIANQPAVNATSAPAPYTWRDSLRDYVQGSAEGLARIPRELSHNVAEIASNYWEPAAQFAAGMLPGAGMVEAPKNYAAGAEAFSQGDYIGAAGQYAMGAYNQATDLIPGTPTLAAAAVPAARRAARAAEAVPTVPAAPKYIPPEIPAGELTHSRIAQRNPTSKQGFEDVGTDLRINQETMRRTPEFYQNASSELDSILPYHMQGASADEKFAFAKDYMVRNLRHLYDTADPELIQRAPKWYPGSHQIAQQMSRDYGIPVESAAGMLAGLSPQKDWFENVDLAKRFGRILAEDPRLSQAGVDALAGAGGQMAAHAENIRPLVGERLSQLSPEDASRAVWGMDRLSGDRTFRRWNPEGEDIGLATRDSDPSIPLPVSHQAMPISRKAVNSFRSGGDTSIISREMGGAHKIRNFYNDIIAPHPEFDDWTNDTHNIAASLLRPLGSSDEAVTTGLGQTGGYASATGASGLYGLYADAGREAARQVGMKDPSGMQSAVWERVRQYYPKTFKNAANKERVGNIWEGWRQGEYSEDQARNLIDQLVRDRAKQQPPIWMQR